MSNIFAGVAPTASGVYPISTPSNLTDGTSAMTSIGDAVDNPPTAETDYGYWTMDLGSPAHLSSLTIVVNGSGFSTGSGTLSIEGSDDGVAWSLVLSHSAIIAAAGAITGGFSSTVAVSATYRYFRLVWTVVYAHGGLQFRSGVSIVELSCDGAIVPPDPGSVVDIYDPDDVYLATIPAKDVKVRAELNGVGSGSFAINRYADEATAAIMKPGNIARVTIPQIDPRPILAFFLETGDFRLVSSDEKGGEDIGFSGKGNLSYWARGIWLNESFLVPWWPQYAPFIGVTPPSTAVGAMGFAAGTYEHYTVSGGAITSRTRFSTGGFTAYYDRRVRVRTSPGATTYATVVHLSSGAYSGYWMHAFGAGTRDYRKRSQYTFGPSVLMSSLSAAGKPGEIIRALYDEAKSADRPIDPFPLMTVDFTSTTDSNGDAWTATDSAPGVSSELGDDYLSTIGKLLNLGVTDVEMDPDFGMHAYNAVGRDLTSGSFATGKVRFVKGVNIADDLTREFSEADAPIGTFAEVLGPNDGDVGRAILPTAADYAPREISVRGETSDPTQLEAIGQAELASRLLHADAVGFNVAVPIIGAEDELHGLYLPGPRGSARGNYWTGDYVRLDTGSGENDFDELDVRVAAITLWFSESGDLRAGVEVGSALGGLAILGYPASGSSGSSGGFVGGGTGGSSTSDLYQLIDERDQPNGYPSLDLDGRVDFRELETSWKASVRVVSTSNRTLATGFVPGQVIDGVTLVEGDDVLVAGQTSALENGIRTVPASGAPTRRGDMVVGADVLGAVVLIREGTLGAGTTYRATNTTAPTIDTDAIAFVPTTSTTTGGLPGDALIWRPLMDGYGNVVTDSGTGEAIMALGPQ